MNRFTKIACFQFFFWPLLLWGQIDSYQYKIDFSSAINTLVPIIANEDEELVLIFRNQQPNRPYEFLKFPGINGVCHGYRYRLPLTVVSPVFLNNNSIARGDLIYAIMSDALYSHLLVLNMETGVCWGKRFFDFGAYVLPDVEFDVDGNLLMTNEIINNNPAIGGNPYYPQNGIIELFKLDTMGNTLWKHALYFKESSQGDSLGPHARGIKQDIIGNIYLSGYFDNGILNHDHFLLKLDPQGNPLVWKMMNGMSFPVSVFTNDAIYLLDKNLSNFGFHNNESAIIAKFDYDFNLLWLKKYTGENFPYRTANITASPSGGLYLSSVTTGVYPVILAELDPDGNIVSQKGYAHYNPGVKVLNDGSLVIASTRSVDSLGNPDPRPVIAKTDASGEIAGCVTLQTCLEVSDTTVTFGTFYVEPYPVLDLVDMQVEVEPISYPVTPFCDYPPPPLPTFTFPDSLCLGEAATSLSDRNRLAQTREWQLTGPPGIDSLLRDSFEFSYTFNQPGEYVLRQSVWVLGCRSDYERSITVLPPLTVAIAADSLLCPDEPQEISAMANRNAGYTWNNPTGASNQTGATLPVTASGTYTVTATDGVCEATDSVTVTVVAGILGNSPAFTLPPDTTVCERDMPILLIPQSHFTDVFYFENGAVQAASYPLTSAGVFKVGMEAFGCNFEKLFRLTVDCHADVYLPNSFSPNGDGINDVFQPFGTDFEVLELSIYGRWGGLLHKGVDWDGGKAPKGQAGQGIYVYKLVYRDLLNLETVTLNGEVVLVR